MANLILEALQAHPMGISEYDLIKWLKNNGAANFQDVVFWDRLSLFQTHFILFHTLYKLKDRCWKIQNATLSINPLNIMLLPSSETNTRDLASHDPLMEYYLDLDNLINTSEQDVTGLLEAFWRTLGHNDKRKAALEELELRDPVDFATIKQQHRRLVMQHHPDRGGRKEKLQSINAAMDLLEEIGKNN